MTNQLEQFFVKFLLQLEISKNVSIYCLLLCRWLLCRWLPGRLLLSR